MFKTGKLFSPFRVHVDAHTVSPYVWERYIMYMKEFLGALALAECAWVVWKRLTALSEGTKVSLKFLGVLCNASHHQIWKISVKSLSGRKAFFSWESFGCRVGRGVFARYVWNVCFESHHWIRCKLWAWFTLLRVGKDGICCLSECRFPPGCSYMLYIMH